MQYHVGSNLRAEIKKQKDLQRKKYDEYRQYRIRQLQNLLTPIEQEEDDLENLKYLLDEMIETSQRKARLETLLNEIIYT